MKIGSLFSGIGGIELGFEKAGGFETKWFVENNPYCQAVLRKHWPSTPIYGDIKTIDFTKLEKVEILTGGFPCQDISNAGKRKGITGERSGLWKDFFRVISQIRPKYAFIENVSALRQRGLDTVLCDLSSLRYNAEWHCLCASDIGALHKRERIFIIAYPDNNGVFRQEGKTQQWGGLQAKPHNSFIADNLQERIKRFRKKTLEGKSGLSWCKNVRSIKDLQKRRNIPKPIIRRTSNGFRQRLHAIGNSVVPQCAEFFAEIIKKREGLK